MSPASPCTITSSSFLKVNSVIASVQRTNRASARYSKSGCCCSERKSCLPTASLLGVSVSGADDSVLVRISVEIAARRSVSVFRLPPMMRLLLRCARMSPLLLGGAPVEPAVAWAGLRGAPSGPAAAPVLAPQP